MVGVDVGGGVNVFVEVGRDAQPHAKAVDGAVPITRKVEQHMRSQVAEVDSDNRVQGHPTFVLVVDGKIGNVCLETFELHVTPLAVNRRFSQGERFTVPNHIKVEAHGCCLFSLASRGGKQFTVAQWQADRQTGRPAGR